ncbi:uncharacterized protein LOC133824413 [Humulus lupulus]|uniref:uncharacterized protein LOC133824413 n=1 Tax=Humulus lupulus TaxID=3486 RepID=UPI002B40DD8D|nr:uncharacterized protein LOC133824413 [Humulus lupulus]
MVDKFTRERTRVQFARILVEVELSDNPPRIIHYMNEHGQLVEQGVEYEWLPVKCKNCEGYGHIMSDCCQDQKPQLVQQTISPELEKEKIKLVPVPTSELATEQVVNTESGQGQSLGSKEMVEETSVCRDRNQRINGKRLRSHNHSFSITFVYGRNTLEERKALWQGLAQLDRPTYSWMVLGDFNALFTARGRSGGKSVSPMELVDPSNWIAMTNLEALMSTGSFYTWTNNQEGGARIYSKIDHAFINEDWLGGFPNTSVVFKWETVSDHCSCTISMLPVENLGIKPFRFYNFWTDHVNFKQLVMDNWRQPMRGKGLKSIYLKTMRLKHKLKSFNMDCIGDLGVNYQSAKDQFQEALLQAQLHPHNPAF